MESEQDFYVSCQCAGLCGRHEGLCDVGDRAEFGIGSSVSRHGVFCRRCTDGEDNSSGVGVRITMSTVVLSSPEGHRQRFVEYATLPRELTRDGVSQVTRQLLQRLSNHAELLSEIVNEAYQQADENALQDDGPRFTWEGSSDSVSGGEQATEESPHHPLVYWQPSLTAALLRPLRLLQRRPTLRGVVTGWTVLLCLIGVLTGMPVNLAALFGGTSALSPTELLLTRARLDVFLWGIELCFVAPALVVVLSHYRLQRMLRRRLDQSSTHPLLWPGVARVAEAMKFNSDAADLRAEMNRMQARVRATVTHADAVERMFCEIAWGIEDHE